MALYLEKAIFVNRAPFENIELNFKEKGINVLAAINGRGKTTILSHITDAFYELAKLAFTGEFAGKENKYYRVSSPLYNLDSSKSSFVYLRFRNNKTNIDYIDIRRNCTSEEYDAAINIENKIPYNKFSSNFDSQSTIKYWHIENKEKTKLVSSLFKNNILTYFPAYRYEKPSYLNDPYQLKIEYKIDSNFSGYLSNPIEVVTGMHYLLNWIMDVVIDWETYKKTETRKLPDGTTQSIDISPEFEIWKNINTILRATLASKVHNEPIRLGLGKRNNGGTRISVVSSDGPKTISPNISCLSSGETAMLCCFGELLRQADNIHPNTVLENITGIVLIDEIDKHLHIKLQKECLPKLFNLFPNVQFIVSSHSPFLNMGLADDAGERTQIFDLDNNGIACSPENNILYKEVYDLMVNENQRYADKYKELDAKIKDVDRPIIITEGKTDWKHIKAALAHFKSKNEYEDINVEILEYDFDFGDSKLHNLLNQYKLFPHRYKVVGIFDCDEANGKNIHTTGGIKKYSANIWGMSIPVPEFRNYNTSGISIEFLYHDDDLKRKDENGRRLYITSEFNENGRLIEDVKIGVKNNHDVKNYIQPSKEKIQADEVIDIDGNSLALSKEMFAKNILEKNGDFANVSFDAFKSVFDRLKEVLNS